MLFLSSHYHELLVKIGEQLFLAGSSLFLAILISLPLGVLIAHSKKLRGPILTMVNILQTIPSLAVLAFLLPFLGIGTKPALITLTIYGLLPIVRGTATGILTIPPQLIESSKSLGFSARQSLFLLELPLAMPVILSGIRTACTLCVGTATLAAFVGGGGLGDFIYQGLSLNNYQLILLGAIPSALLVVILDFLIARAEMLLGWYQKNKQYSRYRGAKKIRVPIVTALLLVMMIGGYWPKQAHDVINVGARCETEQMVLGEIIAQVIEQKTHLHVQRQFHLMSASMAHQAMISAQLDIIPEYTGTAYVVNLHGDLAHRPHLFNDYLSKQYHQKFHFKWLPSFGFNNSSALLVSKRFADQYHLHNIEDLAKQADRFSIAVPSGFFQRDDGYLALHNGYGLNFSDVKLMDQGLLYEAVAQHQVNIGMVSGTDGRLVGQPVVILKDNKTVFPLYDAAPIIRESVLKSHPEIARALGPVLGKLNEKTIRQLNYEVVVKNQSVQSVVSAYLSS